MEGSPPDPDLVVQRYRRKALQQIEDSEKGLYRFSPTRYIGFVEHYYPNTEASESWEDSVAEIARQLTELKNNRVFQRVLSVLLQVREVEELKQVTLGDVKVWVSIDVLVGDEAGGFTIVDWKTGKAHTDDTVSAQLGVYALYVLKTYLSRVPEAEGLEKINTLFANLRVGEHKVWSLTVEDLDRTRRLIQTSADAMRDRLDNIGDNIGLIERFPQIPEGSEACKVCRFRATCER
jgi:CRISPR/Cas system-associated exonuclease Cas4 (RecB family)